MVARGSNPRLAPRKRLPRGSFLSEFRSFRWRTGGDVVKYLRVGPTSGKALDRPPDPNESRVLISLREREARARGRLERDLDSGARSGQCCPLRARFACSVFAGRLRRSGPTSGWFLEPRTPVLVVSGSADPGRRLSSVAVTRTWGIVVRQRTSRAPCTAQGRGRWARATRVSVVAHPGAPIDDPLEGERVATVVRGSLDQRLTPLRHSRSATAASWRIRHRIGDADPSFRAGPLVGGHG